MTRLDPSPHRQSPRAWTEESRGQENFSRYTDAQERGGESGYSSLRRVGSRTSVRESSSPPAPYRHREFGRPLPSTRSPERKACIPFRNPELGIPSKRRNSVSSNEPALTSPPRYPPHSNFRHSPRSPSPYTPSPCYMSPTPAHFNSRPSSNRQSRRSSASRQRGSVPTRSSSPSRSPSPYRRSNCSGSPVQQHFESGDYPRRHGRDLRSPSQNLYEPGLDSERLYKNLNSIAGSTDFNRQSSSSSTNWDVSGSNTSMNGYSHGRIRESRNPSPTRRGFDTPDHSPKSQAANGSARCNSAVSYSQKSWDGRTKNDPGHEPGSWGGSSHSLCSPAFSRGSSPQRRGMDSQHFRRASEKARSPSPEYRRSSRRERSTTRRVHGHASSQSSLESEVCNVSGGTDVAGLMEEYVVMADIPKTKPIHMREGPRLRGRSQSHRIEEVEPHQSRRYSHTTDADSRERGRGRERGRDRREKREHGRHGRQSEAQTTATHPSLRSSHPVEEDIPPLDALRPSRHTQTQSAPEIDRRAGSLPSPYPADRSGDTHSEKPDLLNFKKGWMSKLDPDGEWKKHWFVLTDSCLRFYRDSEAEEKDDLDGEINLQNCMKVSECDVEKNYGFQIQTKEAIITLSAVTSGIRKNWVEVIRKTVLPNSSPDITQLPDGGIAKDTPLSRPLPTPRHSFRQTHGNSGATPTPTPRSCDYAELGPVTVTDGSLPTNEKELGEGRTREKQKRSESRTRWFEVDASKMAAGSPWDSVVLKKGLSEEDVEKRWSEFERRFPWEAESTPRTVTLGEQKSDETLQREVESLRQQLDSLEGDGNGEERGQCGSEASWGLSLEVMEKAHRQALEELQKRHDREIRELEREKERLLREETQATAQAMEVLKKAHREELERELEKVRIQTGAGADTQALHRGQQSEAQALQRELEELSERYSQKCLELNRVEQCSAEREREISRREREMTQLRRENQELQSRLTEEIGHLRHFGSTQGSEGSVSLGDHELSSCDMEMLLRVKENELQYLRREISCLRDELHSLNKEKRSACDRYKEVYSELGRMKSRSEQEIDALKEHLRLAMAALEEGQQQENNPEH